MKDIELLVVSLLKGFPISPIYVYRTADGLLNVITEIERLLSLFLYYNGIIFDEECVFYFNNIDFTSQNSVSFSEYLKNNFL